MEAQFPVLAAHVPSEELLDAISSGNIDTVKVKIEEEGAFVNYQDKYKISPVHCAALFNQLDILKLLIENYGADYMLGDKANRTPLQFAVSKQHGRIVQYLGRLGDSKQINHQDQYGCTALHGAAGAGSLECVKILLEEFGADPTLTDSTGMTALESVLPGTELYVYIQAQIESSNILTKSAASVK